MDGTQEGTPNPLNQNPENNINMPPIIEEEAAVVENITTTEPVVTNETVVVSEASVPQPPKKKKKTGLIIGMIICFFLAAGCGVAALLIFLNNNGDQVKAAINKIMSGEAPTNLVADGTIDIVPNDTKDLPYSRFSIDLKTEAVPDFKTNTATATINFVMKNGNTASVKFDEVYTSSGDLFIRIDGVKDFITSQANTTVDMDETGALDYAGLDNTTSIINALGIIELFDGEWLKISQSELALITSNVTLDNNATCMTNFIEDLGDYSNTMADIYSKNQFVESSKDDLKIASKQDTLYKINVKQDKLEGFISAVQNTKPVTDLFNCMGMENATVNIDNLADEFKNTPDIYVEVDGNNNFTRFYMSGESDNNTSTIKADFSLSYPSVINITEPMEYKEFLTVIQELFINNGTDVVIEEEIL